jgi:HEPN domain-containing protein
MPTTKGDFQMLADKRVREAVVLLNAKEWDGAYYLAGYAAECALKACIIKRLNASDAWPAKRFTEDCYKHELPLLLRLADLETEMTAAGPVLVRWVQVKDWSEQSRYELGKTEIVAKEFIEAVVDTAEGVLPWLKARW